MVPGSDELQRNGKHPLIPVRCIIGELAPLLSVLGHEMHKRHKTSDFFWPDLDAVLKLCCSSFRAPPCIFLPVSHLPCDCEKFTVITHAFQCKCKWWFNFFMLRFLIFVGLISLQSNQVCLFRYLLLMSPISFKIFHLSIWELLLLSGEGFLLELQVHINLMPLVWIMCSHRQIFLNRPFCISRYIPFTQ